MDNSAGSGVRARRTGRIAAGAIGSLVALVYLNEARGLRLGTLDAPGPGVFPLLAGAVFLVVSLAVLFEAWREHEGGPAAFPQGADLRRLLIVAAGFVLFIALLNVVGFALAGAVFVAFYSRVVGKVSWPVAIVSGIAVTGAVCLVFGFLLEVRLPRGIWR